MKPWIKYCIIYNIAYLVFSSLFSALTKYKISFLELLILCFVFNVILFLIFRNKPERIPLEGEIVRIKNPLVEVFEKLKNKWEVKK